MNCNRNLILELSRKSFLSQSPATCALFTYPCESQLLFTVEHLPPDKSSTTGALALDITFNVHPVFCHGVNMGGRILFTPHTHSLVGMCTFLSAVFLPTSLSPLTPFPCPFRRTVEAPRHVMRELRALTGHPVFTFWKMNCDTIRLNLFNYGWVGRWTRRVI